MSIKLLSIVRGQRGVIKRYQHHEFGVLPIVIVWGTDGSADMINFTPVAHFIRTRNRERLGSLNLAETPSVTVAPPATKRAATAGGRKRRAPRSPGGEPRPAA
jgi:hypothetical protein